MISRKSTLLLANAYDDYFSHTSYSSSYTGHTSSTYKLSREALHDFLYERDYEPWFLNSIKKMYIDNRPRQLKEFLMRIHTGESLTQATPEWSWQERQKLGQRYIKDLSEDILKLYGSLTDTYYPDFKKELDKLKSQLELDGYIFNEGTLYPTESSVIDEKEEESYLLYLSKKLVLPDLKIIEHHLKLSEEQYINSKWDDSISNSRKFFESVLMQLANELNFQKYGKRLEEKFLERPLNVREYLEKEKLIEKKEKEAISKVYGLLSDTGSHPYIAEKDQARLMRHLALTFSQFVLLRFEGFLITK